MAREAVEQPLFALMADDDLAPGMVMIWACFKNGDLTGALREFNELAQERLEAYEDKPAPQGVIDNAIAIADAMEDWQADKIG